MHLEIRSSKAEMAQAAADHAHTLLTSTIAQNGHARLIAATGASQLDFLDALTAMPGIAWDKVEMFHLDEYVGVGEDVPASFCRYLRSRLIEKVGIRNYHLLDGTRPPQDVIAAVGAALRSAPIDIAFVGIGENGHLAFNDPPADFETEAPYLVVNLDDACRRQQLGEGWFATLDDVPRQAISMTIRQIMKAKNILAIVPDARKADAVQQCLEGEISPLHPSSILREHANTTVYLDGASAGKLSDFTCRVNPAP
jgi:glucosamine-6-phosphate deaminase